MVADNLGDILKTSYVNGEQNVITFAASAYLISYLRHTHMLTPALLAKARSSILTGTSSPSFFSFVPFLYVFLLLPVHSGNSEMFQTFKTFHKLVSELVGAFEPGKPQRITLGLNTNFTLSPSYSFHKSSYQKSCSLSLFIFLGHSKREPASGRVTYFILRAYIGNMC